VKALPNTGGQPLDGGSTNYLSLLFALALLSVATGTFLVVAAERRD
jgi:hypothetical protein